MLHQQLAWGNTSLPLTIRWRRRRAAASSTECSRGSVSSVPRTRTRRVHHPIRSGMPEIVVGLALAERACSTSSKGSWVSACVSLAPDGPSSSSARLDGPGPSLLAGHLTGSSYGIRVVGPRPRRRRRRRRRGWCTSKSLWRLDQIVAYGPRGLGAWRTDFPMCAL
jgi:hypothetical protein